MTFTIKGARRATVWVVCWSLLIPIWPMEAAAQRRIIVINAEQPNLWTLEQAHYLLAQMHRRNLDLKAKSLADLDPNEIAGLRFDVMRMLIEFGATFNQADLASNRLLADNQNFNAERRQQLVTERDGLRRESLRLTGEIEELETEKAGTDDKDEQKRIDARIAAKTNHLERVDKDIEQLNAEIATLNAPLGQLKATDATVQFDPNRLPKSAFDDAFKEAAAKQIAKFNEEPRLNASLRLDNFLQMQYEIISKQLALLRDELGPGERLVFLELPQTLNAAHHESKRKWAQSWWKIAGYTKRVRGKYDVAATPTPIPPVFDHRPITTTQDFESILGGKPIKLPLRTSAPCPTAAPKTFSYEGADDTSVVRIKDGPSPHAADDPHPTSINVSGLAGTVKKVVVTLKGLRHPKPEDVDILLVGPQGQNALIMSDAGGNVLADGVTLALYDDARLRLPAASPLPTPGPGPHPYRPTNHDTSGDEDKFPGSVPAPLGGDALSVFSGTDPNGTWTLYIVDESDPAEGSLSGGWSLHIETDCAPPGLPMEAVYHDEFFELKDVAPVSDASLKNYLSNRADLSNRMVRTVELIPRQSSLNVNDMNLKVKAGALNFVLSTLFGFGSRLSVQRQREQFSQFVQQELYSAAFGKGAREFGWTFTPMPGTDRLHSGVRTTYAVVVVPEDASSLILEANGCYFPRSHYPPKDFKDTTDSEWNRDERTSRNCGGERTKAFVVPIPSARVEGGNEFWVEKIDFQPVPKGKRAVVAISGKNFSPQVGILVDGVPLVHAIGLAQPLIRDDSAAGRGAAEELRDAEVSGRIERIDADKIVFSVKMSADYVGTPTITLIAPGRARDINMLDLVINDGAKTTLATYPKKMFGNAPAPGDQRIDKVRVTRGPTVPVPAGSAPPPPTLTAVVSGAGFQNGKERGTGMSNTVAQVLVNGAPMLGDGTPPAVTFQSPELLTVRFPAPADDTVKVSIVFNNPNPRKVKTVESEAVANPAFLSVSDVEILSYEPATEDEPSSTLVVRITGTGFTNNLTASFGTKTLDVAIKSATEAVLAIPDPKAASVVTLRDTATGQEVKIVATRKVRTPR